MDFRNLASRLGFEEDEFMELVELFIHTCLKDIRKIKKGVRENSHLDAAAASHSIKGAAANLGFEKIAGLSADMEQQAKNGVMDNFEILIDTLEQMVLSLKGASL